MFRKRGTARLEKSFARKTETARTSTPNDKEIRHSFTQFDASHVGNGAAAMAVEVVDAMEPHPAGSAHGSSRCASLHTHRYRACREAHGGCVEAHHGGGGGGHGKGKHGDLLVDLLLLLLTLRWGAVASVGRSLLFAAGCGRV